MQDRSVSTLNVPPRAVQPKPHLQTFFPPLAPPNFNQHFADPTTSPYSSGSSSSFPTESPPAEPPFEMEPDYAPMISSPDDIRYGYPAFDHGDPADWTTRELTALSAIPYNAEVFAQQPMTTPMSAPQMSWPSDTKKFPPQQFQQQQPQTQHPNYPSFSGQAGRLRSLSDGTPSGTGGGANGMHSLYAQHNYSRQDTGLPDLVYPQDAIAMSNGPDAHSHNAFPSMHSYSHEQQQPQHHHPSPQPVRVKRELGRSMSDAAAPPIRPPSYMSSSQPSGYESYGMTMHTTSTRTTTLHSSSQGTQLHVGYPPQHVGETQPNLPASMPMSMHVPAYDSLPTYSFNEQTSGRHAGRGSGGHLDQNAHASEELSPMTEFQHMEGPRYMNGDGGTQGDYKTNETGVVKKEDEDETYERRLGAEADEGADFGFVDAEGEEDADGDDDRDGDYQAYEDDEVDDDGDGEYVIRNRKTTTNTNMHTLRPRRHSSTPRYQPYSFSSIDSISPSASKPIRIPFPPSTASRPKTKTRSRQAVSLPVPVPVPNLTKKSRGRRVPTVDSLATTVGASVKGTTRKDGVEDGGGIARTYTCDAAGCGKCFARGEHLKRHVRSIHTYEKRQCFYSSVTSPALLIATQTHSAQMSVSWL